MHRECNYYIEGLKVCGVFGCTLCVSTHANVCVVRGLLSKRTQAVGYFLSSVPLPYSLLSECEKAGAIDFQCCPCGPGFKQ